MYLGEGGIEENPLERRQLTWGLFLVCLDLIGCRYVADM
jgi:hypothetical protein